MTIALDHSSPHRITRRRDEIEVWLVNLISSTVDIPAEDVDVHAPFDAFGIDSQIAISLTDTIGEWLGRDLDATIFYEHSSIEALAGHLIRLQDGVP